ncbi:type IV secretion system protein [uncultured Massilia sp.]|uniref:type IV secretion system protein n=1 Tax=uncultured Massilia sp. TaxID=169973 RepID=UPI0025E3F089|nr:type IV secretion system protein [uncultured Massilia sp.]
MAAPTNFFTANLQYIEAVCDAYVGEQVAVVARAIEPAAFTFLGVYVVLWGFASMRGLIKEPLMDMAERVLKVSLIFGVGIGLAEYNTIITETFLHGPGELAAAMARSPDTGGFTGGLDTLFSQGFDIGRQFWAKAGLFNGDMGLYFIALAIWTLTIVVTAYGFFLMALSKVALTAILALGSLFILGLLFESTAGYFNSWIRQLSNYFLVPILVMAVNLLVLKLFSRAASDAAIANAGDVDQIFPFMAMGLVSLLALASVLTIAAGLAGGVSLSSFGAGRLAVGVMQRHAMPLVGKGVDYSTRPVRYAGRKAWSATQGAYRGRARNSISLTKKK